MDSGRGVPSPAKLGQGAADRAPHRGAKSRGQGQRGHLLPQVHGTGRVERHDGHEDERDESCRSSEHVDHEWSPERDGSVVATTRDAGDGDGTWQGALPGAASGTDVRDEGASDELAMDGHDDVSSREELGTGLSRVARLPLRGDAHSQAMPGARQAAKREVPWLRHGCRSGAVIGVQAQEFEVGAAYPLGKGQRVILERSKGLQVGCVPWAVVWLARRRVKLGQCLVVQGEGFEQGVG